MKKSLLLISLFLSLVILPAASQGQESVSKPQKNDQALLANDVYVSYGIGSLYFIVNQNSSGNYKTAGGVIFGYARALGKIISVGFQGSFTNITHNSGDYAGSSKYSDNYWSGLANIRFRYYNRPSFCMYSGMAIGIALDSRTETNASFEKTSQKYLPAGQLTLLGFRVGRALSFYGEFGIGTNAIINAGVSYKFGE